MPSVFAALEDALSDAVDVTFGEMFVVIPMARATVNSQSASDPSRHDVTLQAVLDDRSASGASFARLNTAVSGRSGHSEFTVTSPLLFVESRRLGAYGAPKRNDRVRRVDTGDLYEIIDASKDGQGRYKLAMLWLKNEPT